MTVTYRIGLKPIQLEENSSLGLHIKKKRLDLRLRQKDVALLVGVTEECIMYWETGFAQPQIQYAPKIIEFLGYNPYGVETESLGGKVKNYRLLHGLSHKKMGRIVGVDGATISTWETAKHEPQGTNLTRLNELLSN
jgi:DNA-binding XRE family transcriptional regulator